MTFWKSSFLSLFILSLVGCGDSSSPNKIRDVKIQNKTLTMVTSADNPPYEFFELKDGVNKIKGLDVEIAEELGKVLDIKIIIQDMDFNGLISAVQSGRADFSMADFTITEERLKNVDFSNPYLNNQIAMVYKAEASEITSFNMKGKKIGLQLGSSHDKIITDIVPNGEVQIVYLNKLGELVQELRAGRIDGVVMDLKPAETYVTQNNDLKFNHLQEIDNKVGIILPKGSPWLVKFNEALEILKKNGKLDMLIEKWLKN